MGSHNTQSIRYLIGWSQECSGVGSIVHGLSHAGSVGILHTEFQGDGIVVGDVAG